MRSVTSFVSWKPESASGEMLASNLRFNDTRCVKFFFNEMQE